MSRRGTTLIESVIAIFIVSVVLVTFLLSLSIAITGTLDLNRKTSALNLARSEIEHAKAQMYNVSTGNLSDTYGEINISDWVNYNISGQVSYVGGVNYLQQITVNVTYSTDKKVQLIGYKISDGSLAEPPARGLMVTDIVPNVPTLPQGYGGFCLGTFKGYYHIFTTSTAGPVSVHWKFHWNQVSSGPIDIGCPVIGVYNGTPDWVSRDYLGVVREDGMITRNQNGLWLADVAGIGDLPGPGDGSTMCTCCADAAEQCAGETSADNPLYYIPHNHYSLFSPAWWLCALLGGYWDNGGLPCCGYSDSGGEIFWTYDSGSATSGDTEDTLVTGSLPAGTYTVLFFNSENEKNLDTTSASVTYWK